jgi:RNA polymerase I-specific transcription initiation factor RRN6
MSGFPSLQPAFTVRVDIDAPLAVGAQSGSALAIVVSSIGPLRFALPLRGGAVSVKY